MSNPDVTHFYHAPSGTLSYVVSDPATSVAAIVDPVLEFSVVSGHTDTAPAQLLIDFVREHDLTLEWILETHAHADHLSAAQTIKSQLGGEIAVGTGITGVQAQFLTCWVHLFWVIANRRDVCINWLAARRPGAILSRPSWNHGLAPP